MLKYATKWEKTFEALDFSSFDKTLIFEYGVYFDGTIKDTFRSTKNVDTIKIVGSKDLPIYLYCAFYGSDVRVVDLTDCSNIFSEIQQSFRYCYTLEEILGELDVTNAKSLNTLFLGANLLKEVRFKEQSIKLSFGLSNSKNLSDTSIQSIIDGLATVEEAQTITFHADVKAKLTEEQISQITSKNWTLA